MKGDNVIKNKHFLQVFVIQNYFFPSCLSIIVWFSVLSWGTSCRGHGHRVKQQLLTCADEGTGALLEACFWAVGMALLSYCSVSTARLAPVSQPVLSFALCIWGLFRNEPLCMGIMWDIWASAYCSMVKVKAGQAPLPTPLHYLSPDNTDRS